MEKNDLQLNEEQIKNLNEAKQKVIKTGLIGIFVFALAITGAILSFYIGKTPEYQILKIVILLVSVILFLVGLVILYFFKDLITLYKLIKDHYEAEDEEDDDENGDENHEEEEYNNNNDQDIER